MHCWKSIQEIQRDVLAASRLRVRGGGSKPGLSGQSTNSLSSLSGIIEYNPSEYTFTAGAGTSVQEIEAALGEHGQFLPFDAPWAESGATLGGVVASGIGGPGRLRFGGVRDFLLGARFVSGAGEDLFGGGKVVKNAAGFDIPKLMVGSLGEFGVLVELTFKVFPRPQDYCTLKIQTQELVGAIDLIQRLANSPLECAAIEFDPAGWVWVRLGGFAEALEARARRIAAWLESFDAVLLQNQDDRDFWRDAREFRWADGQWLIRIPITSADIEPLEEYVGQLTPRPERRYGVAGNVAWLTWPESLEQQPLLELCRCLGRAALAVRGPWSDPRIHWRPNAFHDRLRGVFDPRGVLAIPTSDSITT